MNEHERFGWHPFRYSFEWREGGPFIQALYVSAIVAIMLFLWRTFRRRRRSEPFLSSTLLLAIAPLIIFSILSYLQLVVAFWAGEQNRSIGHFDTYAMGLQVGYAYQFGVVLSATLLIIHSVAHALVRIGRNA